MSRLFASCFILLIGLNAAFFCATHSSSASCTSPECREINPANGFFDQGALGCFRYSENHAPKDVIYSPTAMGGTRAPFARTITQWYDGNPDHCTKQCPGQSGAQEATRLATFQSNSSTPITKMVCSQIPTQ